MKKHIFALATVCAAACFLGACVSANENENGGAADGYAALNEMLRADYSRIVLTVTDTFDEATSLTSEYTIDYSENGVTVHYFVERFEVIDGTMNDILPAPKTTLTGEALIVDGAIVSVSGDDVALSANIGEVGLTFDRDYFENAELAGIYLKADVKNAAAFLGRELTCTDMKVSATFFDFFNEIEISYTSASGSSVEYRYVFTL